MITLVVAVSLLGAEDTGAERLELFEKKIRPVLAERCFSCHSSEAKRLKGGLRLDARERMLEGGESGPAIIPGRPEASLLLEAIRYADPDLQMPPDGKLTDRQIGDFVRWIEAGAPWPEGRPPASESARGKDEGEGDRDVARWAFQPIARRPPPPVQNGEWPLGTIDRFILAKLESAGLSPAPPADRRTLLRRVYFDLIGLPPSPAEIQAFLSDASPHAFEKVVDRLLASPHHGERWGRHWLDLVRYAETAGNEFDYEIRFAWRYRDYVIRALNEDLPYDRFVVEHIAGDLLSDARRHPEDGSNESIIGTGFYWLGQAMQSPIDVLEAEYETIENQIDVLSKTFLGLTVACARCHDHKFDPISTRDYYALVGYLQSSRRQYAFIDSPRRAREIIAEIEALDAAHHEDLRDYTRERLEEYAASFASRLLDSRTLSAAAASGGGPGSRAAGDGTKGASGAAGRSAGSAAKARARRATVPDPSLARHVEHVAAADRLDVLHAWAMLSSAPSRDAFEARRRALLKSCRARIARGARARSSDVIFEDFDDATYPGWERTGLAFESPRRGGLDLLPGSSAEAPVGGLIGRGMAHSGRVSGRLRGTLRSRTFRIEKRFIDYRVTRTASAPPVEKIDPGDLKDGQIHLILDGFHLIRQPIYEGLTIDCRADGKPRWYRQDVSKWVGHRAYIEITDEDNGVIAVDRIVFSDGQVSSDDDVLSDEQVSSGRDVFSSGERPPAVPDRLLLELLEDDDEGDEDDDEGDGDDDGHVSPETLAHRYQDLLTRSVELWSRGLLASSPEASERLGIIDWMLEHAPGLRGSAQAEPVDPRLPEAVADYLSTRRSLEARIPAPRRALAMADGTGEDTRVLTRGNHERPGDVVPRRFLAVLGGGGEVTASGSGRISLARRMVGGENPLLARVVANRIWQHHFGRGIVATPDDFGAMGEPPTHPELLDVLAAELVRGGWSLKRMHRLIVTSRAYRMSSRVEQNEAAVEHRDPENRLLHRMPLRRMEGEIIRDAILAISGRLDRRMEGPGVMPFLTSFMEGRGRPSESGPLDGDGRRSIYIGVRRNFLSPAFLVFDYPVPESTTGRRAVSNVPAQALTMLNNPLVVTEARRWAERLLAEGPRDRAARIRWLYEMAFARLPTRAEAAAAMEFLGGESAPDDDPRVWADLCHVLMNVREFIFVR